jgi:hypothetical protein
MLTMRMGQEDGIAPPAIKRQFTPPGFRQAPRRLERAEQNGDRLLLPRGAKAYFRHRPPLAFCGR